MEMNTKKIIQLIILILIFSCGILIGIGLSQTVKCDDCNVYIQECNEKLIKLKGNDLPSFLMDNNFSFNISEETK